MTLKIIPGGKKVCHQCGTEYDSEFYVMIGHPVLKGGGYCPVCASKIAEEQAIKEAAEEEATRLAGIANLKRKCLANCGIPLKYQNESLSTFKPDWQDKALEVCARYADEFPVGKRPIGYQSLLLWSTESWGTGKTHLSCAILKRIIERWQGDGHYPVLRFVSEPDLFRRIQATYSFTPQESQIRESESDILIPLLPPTWLYWMMSARNHGQI